MKNQIIVFSIMLIVVLGCKDKSNVDKAKISYEKKVESILNGTDWISRNPNAGLMGMVVFMDDNEFGINGYIGSDEIKEKGKWFVEGSRIMGQYYLRKETGIMGKKVSWRIADDFSSITNNTGVKFHLVGDKINYSLRQLQEEYHFDSSTLEKYVKPLGVERNGKHDAEYYFNDSVIAVDDFNFNIRMKLNGEELVFGKSVATSGYRRYINEDYTIEIIASKISELGEGYQNVDGIMVISYNGIIRNSIDIKGVEYIKFANDSGSNEVPSFSSLEMGYQLL